MPYRTASTCIQARQQTIGRRRQQQRGAAACEVLCIVLIYFICVYTAAVQQTAFFRSSSNIHQIAAVDNASLCINSLVATPPRCHCCSHSLALGPDPRWPNVNVRLFFLLRRIYIYFSVTAAAAHILIHHLIYLSWSIWQDSLSSPAPC